MVKKYIYGLLATSALMLQACTNDIEQSVELPLIPGDSEVEIKLSSTGASVSTDVSTRAAVENGVLDSMGVFCVARTKQDINAAPANIDWRTWSGCVMNNVLSSLSEGKVTWTDSTYYYPISQFYSYDFYGYYPYVPNEQVTVAQNRVTVQYTLNGTEDVIWGRATSADSYAYSARYFRESGNVDKLPSLNLKHMLTRLKFQVKTGEDVIGGGSAVESMKMRVQSVRIKGVKCDVNLTWANTTETADNGMLTLRNQNVKDFVLCEANGDTVKNVELVQQVNGIKPIGESIMLYPEKKYTLEVVLVNSETQEVFVTESTLSLTQENLFEAGKNYNVTITVHGPKEIQLNASLNNWVDAGEDTDNNIDL